MHDWLRIARYSVRSLRRAPAFTAAAAFTLALALGVNSAVFTLINALLIRPLPWAHSDRLALVWATEKDRGELTVSYPDILDWREGTRAFDWIEPLDYGQLELTQVTEPERLTVVWIGSSLLAALGVAPAHGRLFSLDEDRPEAGRVVVLGHAVWQRQFGGDMSVIGRSLTLDGRPAVVVGILPPGTTFPEVLGQFDLLAPFEHSPYGDLTSRANRYLYAIARLGVGISLERAQVDLERVTGRLQQQYPETNGGFGARIVGMREALFGSQRSLLVLLFGAALLVALVAAVNIGNLLLARGITREHELALRATLGAKPSNLWAEVFVETALLALIGTAAGLLLAFWISRSIRPYLPDWVIQGADLSPDWRVFLFTLLLATCTAALCALASGWRVIRDAPLGLLAVSRATSTPPDSRVRDSAAICQLACALTLLIGSGLMVSSLIRLTQVDIGLNSKGLSYYRTVVPAARRHAFYSEALERVRALAAVEHAALLSSVPAVMGGSAGQITDPERPGGASISRALFSSASPGYFRTAGIALLRGRDFSDQDSVDEPNAPAIVNDRLARALWPDEDPIGRRLQVTYGIPRSFEIVGVVRSVKSGGRAGTEQPAVFVPARGLYMSIAMSLVVRPRYEDGTALAAVRAVLRSMDPNLAIPPPQSVDAYLERADRPKWLLTLLISAFAGQAFLLAVMGLYGLLAFAVSMRVKEIGVRMALGAESRSVTLMVMRRAILLTLCGLALGWILARTLSRFLEGHLYGVRATDSSVFLLVAVVFVAVSILASYVPARRAANVDPLVALRCD